MPLPRTVLAGRGGTSADSSGGDELFDIAARDPSAGTGAGNLPEIDAVF